MTKAEELAILRETVERLGTDSYLGPWLREVSAEVAWIIADDLAVTLSIRGTRERALADAESTVAAARAEADVIMARAKAELDRARAEVQSMRAVASGTIRAMAQAAGVKLR